MEWMMLTYDETFDWFTKSVDFIQAHSLAAGKYASWSHPLDKAQIESGLLAKRRQTQRTNMPVITRIVSRRGATLFRRNFHSGEVSALCCENEI